MIPVVIIVIIISIILVMAIFLLASMATNLSTIASCLWRMERTLYDIQAELELVNEDKVLDKIRKDQELE